MNKISKFLQKHLLLIAFLAFTIIVSISALTHEPWADEGQAWLLARDSSFWELLFERLRYEGTPGLWHIYLFPFTRLDFPYEYLSLLALPFAIASGYLILYKLPLPLKLRLLIAFSYFPLYQYATIARNYVLFAFLIICITILHTKKKKQKLYYLLLLLLTHSVFHGALITASLLIINFIEEFKGKSLSLILKSRQILKYVFFILNYLLLFIILLPPQDHTLADYNQLNWFGIILTNYRLFRLGFAYNDILFFILGIFSILLIDWAWKKAKLIELSILLAPLMLFFGVKVVKYWHEGIIFFTILLFLCNNWSLPFKHPSLFKGLLNRFARRFNFKFKTGVFNKVFMLFFGLSLLFNVYFAFYTTLFDWFGAYSGSKAAASYLKEHNLTPIYGLNFYDIEVNAYFPENIYLNAHNDKGKGYFLWDSHYSEAPLKEDTKGDFLLIPERDKIVDISSYFIEVGYEKVITFEGKMHWKDRVIEYTNFILFKKVATNTDNTLL